MKKLFVNKDESVAEVVEKIISEPELEIVLVIPRGTILDESVSNFHLIKREAGTAGKNITVESVDEDVLALAKASRLEAIHPLFKKKKSSSLSDILPQKEKDVEVSASWPEKKEKVKKNQINQEEREEEKKFESLSRQESHPKPRRRLNFKLLLWIVIPLLTLAGLLVLMWSFRRADIAINFKATPFSFQGAFSASTNLSKVNPDQNVLPAEVFSQTKSISDVFPASSRRNVSDKASGKMIVYNAYSSDPQTLLVNTRFLTPDGKIYRLTDEIKVPGAKIKDGQIITSSIEAAILADKPGPESNSGPVEKLSIPGFKGSPKHEKFYGSLIKASGGFIGEKAVPTEKDISAAKEKVAATLKSSLGSNLLSKPEDFKILEGASEIRITKISVGKGTDEKGNFSVFGEAELRTLGFREKDLQSLLTALAAKENPGTIFKNLTLEYKEVKSNFDKSSLSFSLTAEGVLTQDFNPENFKVQILGKDIQEVRPLVLGLNGLSDAKVSIWPSWLTHLPTKAGQIKIKVN